MQPLSQGHLFPTPKGAREERPRRLRLVTWLGEKFIFVAGGPIFQSIVAANICHIQNRNCFSPANLGKLSWDFTAKPYHIYHLKLGLETVKDKNVGL